MAQSVSELRDGNVYIAGWLDITAVIIARGVMRVGGG
jgi:hypothetical protein